MATASRIVRPLAGLVMAVIGARVLLNGVSHLQVLLKLGPHAYAERLNIAPADSTEVFLVSVAPFLVIISAAVLLWLAWRVGWVRQRGAELTVGRGPDT